jgi:probable phosphomutase (TIGR03848 family)
MPTLLLIRHGENDFVRTGKLPGRMPGIHLNEKGRAQAAQLAEALRNVPLAAVYSSPLERCAETAELIGEARNLGVQLLPSLMDTDIGKWQGRELKRLRRLPEWKLVQGAPSRFRFPGGDSFVEQQSRLVAEVERLVSLHKPEDLIALVFHADPIKLVLAYFLGMPLDYFQRLACSTGSVSILAVDDQGAMLHQMNMLPPFSLPARPKRRGRAKRV